MAASDDLYKPRQDLLESVVFYADDFLTHSIDPRFLRKVTQSFDSSSFGRIPPVDAILTPAMSGIAVGVSFAASLDVPCIVARKEVGIACRGPLIHTSVVSYTGNSDVRLSVSERQFTGVRSVLLVDDFISTGSAFLGLLELCAKMGIRAERAAVVFAKPSLGGCQRLMSAGVEIWTYCDLEVTRPIIRIERRS